MKMQEWLQRLRDRIVHVLLAVILCLCAVIAWLVFQPDANDAEWRTVNEQMEQALKQSGAAPLKEGQQATNQQSVGKQAGVGEKNNQTTSSKDKQADAKSTIVWPLDLNTATLDQLDELPGIGPSKAQAILDLRAKLGRFTSVEQLLDVKGIGPKTLVKFRDKVKVVQ